MYLTLKAQFAIADNYPKEENNDELAKMMLHKVTNHISLQTEP